MKIYLFRHGGTDWNKAFRLPGQSNVPLNEYGRELAVKTAQALKDVKFDRVFSSPLEGKCETVLVVAHGVFNRCLLNSLAEIPLEHFWKIALPNCAASILSREKGKLKILKESVVYYGEPVNSRP